MLYKFVLLCFSYENVTLTFNVLSDALELDEISTLNEYLTFLATRKTGEVASVLMLAFFTQKIY